MLSPSLLPKLLRVYVGRPCVCMYGYPPVRGFDSELRRTAPCRDGYGHRPSVRCGQIERLRRKNTCSKGFRDNESTIVGSEG